MTFRRFTSNVEAAGRLPVDTDDLSDRLAANELSMAVQWRKPDEQCPCRRLSNRKSQHRSGLLGRCRTVPGYCFQFVGFRHKRPLHCDGRARRIQRSSGLDSKWQCWSPDEQFREIDRRQQRRGVVGLPELSAIRGRVCGLLYLDRKSTRLNSSHLGISYAVFCLKKKNQ